LAYYIQRGRPILQPAKLPQTPYTWDKIVEKTWENEDLHVPKTIRALKVISIDCGEMEETFARNVAGLVIQETVDNKQDWSFLAHGFDEAWEKVAEED
jgi:hypothetical protein